MKAGSALRFWKKILSFEQLELDTKEIADKRTLPREIYPYLLHSKMVIWWLRLFGFQGKIVLWSDGG